MGQSILVVVDMQNDFIDGVLGTKEAVSITSHVLDIVRSFKGRVVFTQDTHFDNYLSTQEGRFLPVVHCIENTFGWELQRDLKAWQSTHRAPVFKKITFGSTDLATQVAKWHQEEPIESITLIGVCTDICVISNATLLKAYLPDVPIRVIANACAGVTPESHHTALHAMKMCQITID